MRGFGISLIPTEPFFVCGNILNLTEPGKFIV